MPFVNRRAAWDWELTVYDAPPIYRSFTTIHGQAQSHTICQKDTNLTLTAIAFQALVHRPIRKMISVSIDAACLHVRLLRLAEALLDKQLTAAPIRPLSHDIHPPFTSKTRVAAEVRALEALLPPGPLRPRAPRRLWAVPRPLRPQQTTV